MTGTERSGDTGTEPSGDAGTEPSAATAAEPPGDTRPPRVVVADDQTLVRGGFRMILGAAGIPVVAEAADGGQAVAAVLKHRPDVVLMDIRMPEMDGLEATRRILAAPAGSACRIIILTTFDLDQYVYAAITAGASGFLLKDVSPEQLVAAVRLVRSGDALLAPSITRRLVERFAPAVAATSAARRELSDLTPRELEVLRWLARGLSNAELAAELTLSEATVKTHVARILAKLGLRDRVQAVVLAYETGLASPGGSPIH
ncbi:MAG TPA: response regulator transcription factor [Streptosporangiaceae bacterium]|nr:response regulator transcription factor [Streptosporangiaceae bacterium]